jgi:hypothetical protein
MIMSTAAAPDSLGIIAGNKVGTLKNLTLIPRPSSPRGVVKPCLVEGETVMKVDSHSALDEIKGYLAAATRRAPRVPWGGEPVAMGTAAAPRPYGREILETAICTIEGSRYRCERALSSSALRLLHNEQPGGQPYPLDVNDGLFFSEALGPENDQADAYHRLVSDTLMLLRDGFEWGGWMPFERLGRVGAEIQKLDAAFAREKANRPPDRIHQCYGTSPQHPYSKITLCRTAVPVRLGDAVVPFVYEKFLVAYSYLDGAARRSTVTPLHTHPLNFETVYFVSYGPDSLVTEQEFCIIGKGGRPLVGEDGRVDVELLNEIVRGDFKEVTFRLGETHYIHPGEEPVILRGFDSDNALADARLIQHTDGLFRPHQVTVRDDHDADVETLYYAIDNYFGPEGRVFIYNKEGQLDLWSHHDWER